MYICKKNKTMSLGFCLLRIGTTEIIVIALIILLLFGARKIPELMRGLGKGIREFKDASSGESSENKKDEKKDEDFERKS
jgi:sec-independent protein translocase protein TatA